MIEVTFNGDSVTLIGEIPRVGDKAPDAVVVTTELKEKLIGGSRGSLQLLITVPSLDTPVCETETKKFNELLANYKDVDATVVSMDLPFADKRFCETFGINIDVASDFRYRDLEKYGVLIGDGILKGLCARAVFIIDKDGKIAYVQVVPEITNEPDYDDVIKALKEQLSR